MQSFTGFVWKSTVSPEESVAGMQKKQDQRTEQACRQNPIYSFSVCFRPAASACLTTVLLKNTICVRLNNTFTFFLLKISVSIRFLYFLLCIPLKVSIHTIYFNSHENNSLSIPLKHQSHTITRSSEVQLQFSSVFSSPSERAD